ncbi:MAG: ABC transporter ATP-binding protein [Planctomycetes bacterium]|nr:ABC transporter ATP-binding protein [Planctomycetota bacterium]
MRLRAESLSFAYDAHRVLEGVSLELHEGELLGVIGANGTGKSTLLACLHGALRPQHGAVEFDGRDLRDLSAKAIARGIAVVPQRCEVPFPVPVADFVALGRYPHSPWLRGPTRRDQAIVAASLETLQLTPFASRPVSELSGGEFRRVLIAQALAQEPRVLLLDEPVQQLDVRHQLAVMEFARDFSRRPGTAGLVVLHELDLAARYCDRLALLHAGRIVAGGAAEKVLTPANLRLAFGIEAEVERSAATGSIKVVPVAAIADFEDHFHSAEEPT